MSRPRALGKNSNAWNYHSRSDHHSKVACWGIAFDLLRASALLKRHAELGKVAFGINVEMSDFKNDRKKDLDLVIFQPATGSITKRKFDDLVQHYQIALSEGERVELKSLPDLHQAEVGSVLVALEAKACMTAHQKALPRLYDELNSSHLTVHGAHDLAIAAGFVMNNIADRFLSPGRNENSTPATRKWNEHVQPKAVEITIDKIEQLRRRSRPGEEGYDALSIVVIDCTNDGSPVRLVTNPPAPQPRTNYHYVAMIDRLRGLYDTRFSQI
jgi:hypothetical protein